MTELLMCSGVSSITQQLAELMSQARSQRQAQARGQPGWPERQKVCIWTGAAGASGAHRRVLVLCFCSGAPWGTPSKEGTGLRFAKHKEKDAGQIWIRKLPSGELLGIESMGRCSKQCKLIFWAGLLIAVAIHLMGGLKTGFIGAICRGTLSSMFERAWTVGLAVLHQKVIGYQRTNRKWNWARNPHDLPPATPLPPNGSIAFPNSTISQDTCSDTQACGSHFAFKL